MSSFSNKEMFYHFMWMWLALSTLVLYGMEYDIMLKSKTSILALSYVSFFTGFFIVCFITCLAAFLRGKYVLEMFLGVFSGSAIGIIIHFIPFPMYIRGPILISVFLYIIWLTNIFEEFKDAFS